jgi:hypothetical protein
MEGYPQSGLGVNSSKIVGAKNNRAAKKTTAGDVRIHHSAFFAKNQVD